MNTFSSQQHSWTHIILDTIYSYECQACQHMEYPKSMDDLKKQQQQVEEFSDSSLSLPMLRLLWYKAHRCKDLWKPSKPCQFGIHRIAFISSQNQMSTHMPGFSHFPAFLHHFVMAKLAIRSIRVRYGAHGFRSKALIDRRIVQNDRVHMLYKTCNNNIIYCSCYNRKTEPKCCPKTCRIRKLDLTWQYKIALSAATVFY